MNQLQLRGTGVALVTPFKNDKVDFDQLEYLVNFQISNGIDFLVMLGSTGEAATLSPKECRQILDCAIHLNNGRVPIVAGNFGSNNTRMLLDQVQTYDFKGIDAIMSSVPSYNKPNQQGIFEHFMALERVSPVPIIIYNVPGRTAANISAETTIRLAHTSPKFIAIKEASNDLAQIGQIIKNRPYGFSVFSGDDLYSLPIIAYGGEGVISVIANAFPDPFSQMISYALNNNIQSATKIHLLLLDMHKGLYADGNPAGIKTIMQFMNLCSNEVRLPLTKVSEKTFKKLKKELDTVLEQLNVPVEVFVKK